MDFSTGLTLAVFQHLPKDTTVFHIYNANGEKEIGTFKLTDPAKRTPPMEPGTNPRVMLTMVEDNSKHYWTFISRLQPIN